jgi:hypothetical protein
MDENTYWSRLWTLGAIVVCVLILSMSGCTVYRDYLIASSKDPIATACATTTGDYGRVCVAAAGRK